MTSIEHQQLKGITVKNLIVTIVSTASIVVSVMTTYFGLKSDISDVKMQQDAQTRVNEIRMKVLEGEVAVLQTEVEQLKARKPL
ncbi:MAG: hypothetical protein V4592_05545 [Bacteroidota bacterium]